MPDTPPLMETPQTSDTSELPDIQEAMPASPVVATQTAGQLIKAARLRKGLHLAVLSVNLKVPVRKLEALEADALTATQNPVFLRTLAASVCRQLGMDPAPVLVLLPQASNYIEPHGAVRHALITPTTFAMSQRSSAKWANVTWWLAGVMCVLIASLIWLPNPSQWTWVNDASASLDKLNSPSTTVATVPIAVALSPAPADALPMGAATQVPSQAEAVPAPVITDPQATAATAPSSATGLQFIATDSTWVEVRNGQDRIVWSGNLNAGESKNLPVSTPVQVVVGKAPAVQVLFKGKLLDLKPFTKVAVARFEVKP